MGVATEAERAAGRGARGLGPKFWVPKMARRNLSVSALEFFPLQKFGEGVGVRVMPKRFSTSDLGLPLLPGKQPTTGGWAQHLFMCQALRRVLNRQLLKHRHQIVKAPLGLQLPMQHSSIILRATVMGRG